MITWSTLVGSFSLRKSSSKFLNERSISGMFKSSKQDGSSHTPRSCIFWDQSWLLETELLHCQIESPWRVVSLVSEDSKLSNCVNGDEHGSRLILWSLECSPLTKNGCENWSTSISCSWHCIIDEIWSMLDVWTFSKSTSCSRTENPCIPPSIAYIQKNQFKPWATCVKLGK